MPVDASAILIWVLRGAALVAGGLLIYVAAFTYESEDRQIQSRLEDWWLQLADREGAPVTRPVRFLRALARATEAILDRMLGPRLFSARTVSASICYAFAATQLSGLLVVIASPEPVVPPLFGYALVAALGIFVAGSAGALWSPLRWVTHVVAVLVATICLLVAPALIALMQSGALASSAPEASALLRMNPLGVAASIAAAFAYGVVIIYLTRRVARASARLEASAAILALLGVTLALAVAPLGVFVLGVSILRLPEPAAATGVLRRVLPFLVQHPGLAGTAVLLMGPNLLWSFGVLPSAAVGAVLVAHFVTWPVVREVLMRVVHSALRHELVHRKKVLGGLGASLILLGLGVLRPLQSLAAVLRVFGLPSEALTNG